MNITLKRSSRGILLSEAPDGIYVREDSLHYPKDPPVVVIKICSTVKTLTGVMPSSVPPLLTSDITTRWIPIKGLTVEV